MSVSGVLEVGLCATAGPPRVPGPALVASLEPLGAQTGFPLLAQHCEGGQPLSESGPATTPGARCHRRYRCRVAASPTSS